MVYARLVAIVLVLAFIPASASAATIDGPDNYKRWASKSKAPLPDIDITLKFGPCPYKYGFRPRGCVYEEARIIWLDLDITRSGQERLVFFHETGHLFDYYVMLEWSRYQFKKVLGITRLAWREGWPKSPKEKFATAWGLCARKSRIRKRMVIGRGARYRPTPRQHKRICRLINTAKRLQREGQ